jgi:hypothetical protein
VASDRCGIDVTFRLLVIPLLVGSSPHFFFAAVATLKRQIDIKLGQECVRVDVFQFRVVGEDSGRVLSLTILG